MKKKSKNLKLWLFTAGIVFFVAILALFGAIFVYGKIYQNKIYPGVKIGFLDLGGKGVKIGQPYNVAPAFRQDQGLDLGGKTKKEALDLIKEKIDKIQRDGFIFRAKTGEGEKEVVVMPALLSTSDPDILREILVFDPEKTVENAFSLGREGGFWQKIAFQNRSYRTYMTYSLDEAELQKILKENFQELEKPAQDAQLIFTPDSPGSPAGRPGVAPSRRLSGLGGETLAAGFEKYGYAFDYQKAIEELKGNLDILTSETIDLFLTTDEPKIKKSQTGPALERAHEILALAPLTLKYGSKEWRVNRDELGGWLEFSATSASFSRPNEPFRRPEGLASKERPEGLARRQETVLSRLGQEASSWPVSITFNQEKITKFLETIASEINIPAKEAKFQMKDNRVAEFQTSQEGLELDIEKNIQNITEALIKQNDEATDNKRQTTPLSPLVIELIIKKTKPLVSTEEVNTLGIKVLIGQGQSNFRGSPKNRRHNIKVGADHLNGLLIKPEEEFSLVKALGKTDASTGYLPELVIKGNKTIPEYGGGLCQIGTTTFRVALNAGLPILERQPHSYRVSYYEPAGMDATIYNPRPDLRFLNDTGNWILFQTKISGDNLIFEFYGTDDGRKIEMTKPKIFNIIKPGPTKIIETEDLKPGEKKCTERAHDGADAEFTRTVTYPDGEIKSEIWKSHYRPWRAVCLIGVEPKPVETEDLETTAAE